MFLSQNRSGTTFVPRCGRSHWYDTVYWMDRIMEEPIESAQAVDAAEHLSTAEFLVDSSESTQFAAAVEHVLVVSDDPEEQNDTAQALLTHEDNIDIHHSECRNSNAGELREGYKERLRQYREHYDNHPEEAHAIIYRSCTTGDLNESFIDEKVRTIRQCEGDSDFAMQSLIRLLWKDISVFSPEIQERWKAEKIRIVEAFKRFPFWPTEGIRNMDNIIFWSENHIFMTLSAAYLYFQFVESDNSQWEEAHRECKLLRDYMQLHLAFEGVFEANSHVYLPFTLIALINLYDFAHDSHMKEMAKKLIDRIVYLLMLNTDPRFGVANLTASARAFLRTRLRNHGHNINILVYLLLGKAPNSYEGASLLSHLLLTSWEPDMDSIFDAFTFQGFMQLKLSPEVDRLIDLLVPYVHGRIDDISVGEEYTPFLWSAGLLTHPKFVHKSQAFINKYRLAKNVHLWPMQFLLNDMSNSYKHFTLGHCYTNVSLNIYKQPDVGLIMTSFENFSPGKASFQQLPFMVNFVGIPIWAQSGGGYESIAGFALSNTHNPKIRQNKDVLVLSYDTPKILTSSLVVGSMFNYTVRFFWPPRVFLDDDSLVLYGKPYRESIPILYEKYSKKKRRSRTRNMPVVNFVRKSLRSAAPGWFRAKKRAVNQLQNVVATASAAVTAIETGENDEIVDILRRRQNRIRRRQSEHCSNANEEETEEDRVLNEFEIDLYRQNEAHRMWKIGERKDAFVAVLCTKCITQIERFSSKDALLQPFSNYPTVPAERLVCEDKRQSWVVVVGTKREFPRLEDFVDQRLLPIRITEHDEQKNKGQYRLVVEDRYGNPERHSTFEM